MEWEALIDQATKFAKTAPAKEHLAELKEPKFWAKDIAQARLQQEELKEGQNLLDRRTLWSCLDELQDPFTLLEALEKDQTLESKGLHSLRGWWTAVDVWVSFLTKGLPVPKFEKEKNALTDPRAELGLLAKVIGPDGEMREDASPELAKLYDRKRKLKTDLSRKANELLEEWDRKGVLQDKYHDTRGGRIVLPVKITHQAQTEGRVFEASVSKQTVFVEPEALAILGNDYSRVLGEIENEIFRILRALCQKLAPSVPDARRSFGILIHWDQVQAKAALGQTYQGRAIEVTEARAWQLPETAHPILWAAMDPKLIIRNSITIDPPKRGMLISGPNTGGKTVLLKTMGIAAQCARNGFAFPGRGELKVPFFNRVFIDLGDPQSISESLSSFSGHVLTIKTILEKITDTSLVLLDELNSSTDPVEGAALSRAILDEILSHGSEDRGPMLFATTHDPSLKALSLSDPRILSASMEFNEEDLIPSYRLVIGTPGRSRALDVARALGLGASLIDRAKTYLSEGHLKIEETISKLEGELKIAERARKEAERLSREGLELKDQWKEKIESGVSDLLTRVKGKMTKLMTRAEDEIQESLKVARETGKFGVSLKSIRKAVDQGIKGAFEEEGPEMADAFTGRMEPEEVERDFVLKEFVHVPSFKSFGQIAERDGDKFKVAFLKPQGGVGNIVMTLASNQLRHLGDQEKHDLEVRGIIPKEKILTIKDGDAPSFVAQELDLRGKRFEEAMREAEQYCDHAYRAGKVEVTIIHGLGTGVLREGVRGILAKLPYVKEFNDGGKGRGGTGATVVRFQL